VGAQSLFETLGGLLLIIALIVTAAWLLKRYARLPIAGKGLISVLGGISIGPRERVVVLKVDNARLVIGVTPGQIRTLHVLDGEQGVDAGFKNRLAAAQSDVEAEAEQ
jgi:flagellar protein FliO/FliZ